MTIVIAEPDNSLYLSQVQRDFYVIAVVIHKQNHWNKYGKNAANPYDLSLEFAMERLLLCLEQHGQTEITIVAEARGKKEDDELQLSFLRIVTNGTDYCHSSRFKKIDFRLIFRPKKMNIVGTQVADLIAYPTARKVLNPAASNPAFDVIRSKFFEGIPRSRGFKVFP